MGISQSQNLRIPPIEKLRPYGVRVSLPAGDEVNTWAVKIADIRYLQFQRYVRDGVCKPLSNENKSWLLYYTS